MYFDPAPDLMATVLSDAFARIDTAPTVHKSELAALFLEIGLVRPSEIPTASFRACSSDGLFGVASAVAPQGTARTVLPRKLKTFWSFVVAFFCGDLRPES